MLSCVPFLLRYSPGLVKQAMLRHLVRLTAAGFQAKPPFQSIFGYRRQLHSYAGFSREQAETVLSDPQKSEAVSASLYQAALALGAHLRRGFGIKKDQEAMALWCALYHLLGIEMTWKAQDEISITRCFFQTYYSSDVCQLISALDKGLAAGLLPGRQLIFCQRLTEGDSCCRGRLKERPLA